MEDQLSDEEQKVMKIKLNAEISSGKSRKDKTCKFMAMDIK